MNGRPEWFSARARRREVGGPGVAAVGVALLVVGLSAVALTHGLGPWPWRAEDHSALLPTALGVLVVISATTAGAELLVDAAQAPSRHVFCFGALRRTAVVLAMIGLANGLILVWTDFFSNVWNHGRTGPCEIACVGAIGAAVACLLFAAIAARLAWHAYLSER